MIVILKPCKWSDSKVPKTVARVLSSLMQASEDIASVDRGKLHYSAWIKDVCGICLRITTMASATTKFLPFDLTHFYLEIAFKQGVLGIKGNLVPCTFLSPTLAWTKTSFV